MLRTAMTLRTSGQGHEECNGDVSPTAHQAEPSKRRDVSEVGLQRRILADYGEVFGPSVGSTDGTLLLCSGVGPGASYGFARLGTHLLLQRSIEGPR